MSGCTGLRFWKQSVANQLLQRCVLCLSLPEDWNVGSASFQNVRKSL